jgi:hypothetical protein
VDGPNRLVAIYTQQVAQLAMTEPSFAVVRWLMCLQRGTSNQSLKGV